MFIILKQERQKRRNDAAGKSKTLENKIQQNILESHLLSSTKLDAETIQRLVKSKSSSNVFNEEIDDDMFKLPDSASQALLKESDDDENEVEVLSSPENNVLINIADAMPIDFNSYFSSGQAKGPDSFFEVIIEDFSYAR